MTSRWVEINDLLASGWFVTIEDDGNRACIHKVEPLLQPLGREQKRLHGLGRPQILQAEMSEHEVVVMGRKQDRTPSIKEIAVDGNENVP